MNHVRHSGGRKIVCARGFTLIEMIISLALGLIIIAASIVVYTSSSRGGVISQMETQLNEDGIVALNFIQQQIKQAGYSTQVIPSNGATNMSNYRGVAVRGCDMGFSDSGVAFDNLTCESSGSAGAAIAIRYEATLDNTLPTSANLPSNCLGNGINSIRRSDVSPLPTGGAAMYALADNRYMVDASGNQPMLICRGTEKNGSVNIIGTSQPLLANIEKMDIWYGVAKMPSAELASVYDPLHHQIIGYKTAAEVESLANSGVFSSNNTLDRWGRVLSVRICLVVRSEQSVMDAPQGAHSYKDCKNIDVAATDGYLRRAFTTTVLLRNRLLIQ